MKRQFLFSVLIICLMIFSCKNHLKPVRPSFMPMPNLDSLNNANNAIGKHYYLTDYFTNADFDYFNIDHFDSLSSRFVATDSIKYLFRPIKGQFKVYHFVAEYNGLAYGNIIKSFHDFLMIKTDTNNIILDAYQYTLEWGEIPCGYDLYKASSRGVILINQLMLDTIGMVAKRENFNDVELLSDHGIIHTKKK